MLLALLVLLALEVHLALLVPLAKMALMESLAPSGLQVPVDAQEKQALLVPLEVPVLLALQVLLVLASTCQPLLA